jgi:hypothetical protein
MIDRNPKISTEKWIMEGLARAFGICITLRDDDASLTEEQIEQRLIEDGKSDCAHHREELEKANKESDSINKKSLSDWEKEWTKAEADKNEKNKKAIAEAQIIKTRHTQVQRELEAILENNISPTTRNIVKFGLEQLKLVESETQPYLQEPVSLHKYIFEQKKHTLWTIQYHTEELSKALDRADGRLESYRQLKKDVASALYFKNKEGKEQ